MPCQHPLSAKPMLIIEHPFRNWICTTVPMSAFNQPLQGLSGELGNSCKSWWTVWHVHHPSLICSRLKVKQTWCEEGLNLLCHSMAGFRRRTRCFRNLLYLLHVSKVIDNYATLSGSLLTFGSIKRTRDYRTLLLWHHALQQLDDWVMTRIVRSMAGWKYW